MQDLNLALVQADLHWHQPEANRLLFEQLLTGLDEATDVVILPEMFTSGFSMDAPELAEPPDGPSTAWLREQAAHHGVLIAGSLITKDGPNFRNRMYWAFPDGRLLHYDKRHLFRMAGENRHYSPGTDQLILDWRGWRINAIVCYDLRFPVWCRNTYDGTAGSGYGLLVCIANWPQRRRDHWRRLLQARGIENLCYVAGVNRVGWDGNDIYYCGDTLVSDWHGDILAEMVNGQGILYQSLSAEKLARHREKFPAWEDTDDFRLAGQA